MIAYLKSKVSNTNPLRLLYHKVMAMAACVYYRFPSRFLNVIAVTGTKGKTTTTNLIAAVLREAGYKVGMTSTIRFQVGENVWANASKITTMAPFKLQGLLRQMVDEKCTHAVIEVSSHAILQNRIWGVNVDTAVLTNMGEDHLEYHGGFENYMRAKGLLFARLNRAPRKARIQKVSVLNRDDAHFDYFDQFTVDRKYVYGMEKGTCYSSDVRLTPAGSDFVLHVPNNHVEVSLKMPGNFNVYNALAAATVALANNVNVTAIKDALEKAGTIPGRFESIECGQKFHVVVDYAHNTESLEGVLKVYRELTKGKLFVVFGATGGGRDKAKRPEMGAVAGRLADYVIVTNDDPYEEDEWEIIEQVSAGVGRAGEDGVRAEGEGFWKIPDREEAIKLALTLAKEGDTVVVAGKGAEEIQMIHGKAVPWDDRQVIRSLLGREVRVEIPAAAKKKL